jgi:predicted protein tyrosine phosphatase
VTAPFQPGGGERKPGGWHEAVPGLLAFGARPGAGFSARAAGFDVVVDLLSPEEERRVGAHAAEVAVAWLRVPLDDRPWEPPSASVALAVDAVVAAVRRGQRVLVHCASGRNRSALVVALALCELEGLTGTQALDRVRALRWNALSNAAFAVLVRRSGGVNVAGTPCPPRLS